ncbi:SRPBCC family protein [Halomicroarcula sp. F13]|uniref:SRPBCC family protein n=1 Tax=Haloarcula rubra TaxID=2487747 RepID=A0AAW4PQ28_9EURY|nr:SRPBCC family protein [Halomicroarcula rubra]MBX0323708.1 SRPBCC family protein [Halomicroarcula rubra]
MERVSLTRVVDADEEAVRAAMADVGPFMTATGVDGVTVEGDTIEMRNRVGLFEIELDLEIVDVEDAVLAYEQREGVFESMRTEYYVSPVDEGTEVTATTEYTALDLAVIGPVLDSTVVERQRRKELNSQFDWLEAQVT